MPDDGNRNLYDELVLLRTELARQQQALAIVQRGTARRAGRRHRYLCQRLGAALMAALLLALVPLALLAAGPFTDLDPNSPHNANIAAIQAAGITKGCNPPDYTQYCPKDYVTREEMASFLARSAGLGLNPPVANAATVSGYPANGLVRAARGTGSLVSNPLTLSAGFQTAGTVTIAAPGAGYVLVTATAVYEYSSGGSDGAAAYQLRDTAPGGEKSLIGYVTYKANALGQSASTTYLFPVSAAGSQSYVLEARNTSGPVAKIYSVTLTALFVPFGPTGNTP